MSSFNFDYIAGTGGVGKGILFMLEGEHTLGRNESRLAYLTDFKDYCKLHIILHYTTRLIGKEIPIFPIGRVGDDVIGQELINLMKETGMNTRYMSVDENQKTMYAVCFQYPNGEGGNITTSNSASAKVRNTDIDEFFNYNRKERGIVLSVPEVPLETRVHILKMGKKNGCYNVASFLSNEAGEFVKNNYFSYINLLAINQDEACKIADAGGLSYDESNIADVCGSFLNKNYPHMSVLITLGRRGAKSFVNGKTEIVEPFGGKPVSTAGAGDCFLGTVIACIAKGIPLQSKGSEYDISCASQLASLAAGMKVKSKDTIHFGIDMKSIMSYANELGLTVDTKTFNVFKYREG